MAHTLGDFWQQDACGQWKINTGQSDANISGIYMDVNEQIGKVGQCSHNRRDSGRSNAKQRADRDLVTVRDFVWGV